jgi:hypothetical protein
MASNSGSCNPKTGVPWVNPNWLWFTAFVGANLFQSALTRWCLMEDILRKIGIA